MINFKYRDWFYDSSVNKVLRMSFQGGTLSNPMFDSQSFRLNESLCSVEQFTLGRCESSMIKFRCRNVVQSLKDKELTVTMTIGGRNNDPLSLGKYTVVEDTPSAEKNYRDIVAYDALYKVLNKDFAEWYVDVDFPVSLKIFRNLFFLRAGIQQETVDLPNDDIMLDISINPTSLSGRDILTAICEMNGCFGHIGRDGIFHYIFLEPVQEGVFPRNDLYPSDDLFPSDENGFVIPRNKIISPEYSDFKVETITKLIIRNDTDDVGLTVGYGTNAYTIAGNFLLYGKQTNELTKIANRILDKLVGVTYTPAKVLAVGNPCLEVGDIFVARCKNEIIRSYVFERTLIGIQSLTDTYISKGTKQISDNANSVTTKFNRLEGKTNKVIDTFEKFQRTMTDTTDNLQSQITQTAGEITAEVTRAKSSEETLSGRISVTSNDITAEVTRATDAEDSLSSRISVTEEGVSASVKQGESYNGFKITTSGCTIEGDGAFVVNMNNFKLNADGSVTFGKKVGDQITISANGTLSIGGYATTGQLGRVEDEIPTKVSELNNDSGFTTDSNVDDKLKDYPKASDLNESGKVKIHGGNITANTINVDSLNFVPVKTDSIIASINASTEGLTISASKITLSGDVVVKNDLSTAGRTTINGANIQTGTLKADAIESWEITTDVVTVHGYIDCSALSIDEDIHVTGSVISTFANIDYIEGGEIECSSFKLGNQSVSTTTINYQDWQGDTKSITVLSIGGIS